MSGDIKKPTTGDATIEDNTEVVDAAETDGEQVDVALSEEQQKTADKIEEWLGVTAENVSKLDLEVLTDEAKIELAQSVSKGLEGILVKVEKILNTTEDASFKELVAGKKTELEAQKDAMDTYVSKHAKEGEKTTPPGATGGADPLYANARDRKVARRKF